MSQYTLLSGRPEPAFALIVYTPEIERPRYMYSAHEDGVTIVGEVLLDVGAAVGEVVGDVGAAVGAVVGDVGAGVGGSVGPARRTQT
mmetsp:Transcript_41341/g.79073  ORF Transcript_41341/g.79073 Transcript_41341/m.79073 type:complete len:87 (+) Transcript_41341:50-310(+)